MSAASSSFSSPTSPFASLVTPPPPLTTNSRFIPTVNACNCLNLQLSLAPLNTSPTATAAAPTLLHALTNDPTSPFYAHQCLLGHLDSKTIQHESLTVVRAFAVQSTQWVLFRCLGCRMDCFAVEADGADGRCVMRVDMLYNEEIAELHSSHAYSAAFQLVIPATQSSPLTSPSGSSDKSTGGSGAVSTGESLRVALDRSIHAEQLASQMRINQFVAEEQARFAAWEKRGRRELGQLLAYLQETSNSRLSTTGDVPGSPFMPRSPAAVPVSPRPASPTSSMPAGVFQPLHTFLRRPSRQSPRLQRLLMDGLKHSSTMSPTDLHSPAVSIHTIDTSDGDDSGSTPRLNQPTLSSSLPRTGRMSPRQSISGLAVPQLSGLMRRGSRTDQDAEEEAEEADVHTSTDMIVRWREQDEERQREDERRSEQRVQQRRHAAAHRRKTAAKAGQQHDEREEDEADDIFQLDTTSAEDSWTGEGAERDEAEDDFDEEEDEVDVREEKDGTQSRVMEVTDDSADPEEATDEVHEDGALSDDEAVATTSQADILAIARRSSVPFVPIPTAAPHSSNTRASDRQLGMVPSSLPIPIPAPLRQLMNKQLQQESRYPVSSSLRQPPAPVPSSSTAALFSATSNAYPSASTVTLSSSVVDAPRRSSLHNLALERKQLLQRSQPITEAVTYTAQRSLSPEPSQQLSDATQHDTSEPEPFIPPHTLVAEPYFSFSKFRHLAGVKVTGSLGNSTAAGMGGGGLSSSVPVRDSVMGSRGSVVGGSVGGGGVMFRKDDEAVLRKAGGASALSAALGGRRSGGGSSN